MTEFPYPYTPRRSWIMLADAISRYVGLDRLAEVQQINKVIDILPMEDRDKLPLIETFGALRNDKADTRANLAHTFATLLDGREKFNAPRFYFHATSDDSDNKWKYNELHPETAMKTTIESDRETVVIL